MTTLTQARVAATKFTRQNSALDTFLSRGLHKTSFGHCFHFAEPTPEELAAQEEAKQEALIEKLTPKISEAIERKYKVHLDGQSAEITRLKKLVEKSDDKKDDKDDVKARMSAADKSIDERLQKVEERDGKVTTKAIKSGVKSILSGLGHNGSDLTDAQDLFMLREGAKLSLAEDDETVMYAEAEGATPVALEDVVKAGKLKKYQKAKALPKSGPSSAPAGMGGDGLQEMTPAEFAQAQRDGAKIDLTKIKLKI